MYYFTIAGMECRCETVEELRAVVGQPTATTKPTATTRAKARKGRASKVSRRPRAAATEADSEMDTGRNSGKEVPYVEGGITWDVAKKIAKRLHRTDVRQVRSDLKQRQLAGK